MAHNVFVKGFDIVKSWLLTLDFVYSLCMFCLHLLFFFYSPAVGYYIYIVCTTSAQ